MKEKGLPELPDCGLVLEGGGLRGVYTSGVLRACADLGLEFPAIVGTSMGACNAVNYIARQRERNRIVNIRYVRDRRYISHRRLLWGGEVFGMDFIFGEIPRRLVPFDFETFLGSSVQFTLTTSDVDTGEAVYLDKRGWSPQDVMTALRAATSLPFIAKPVRFQGRRLMDGGLTDSIPLAYAQEHGPRRQIVVLTQPEGYRKSAAGLLWALPLRHPGCPGLPRALAVRHEGYNRSLDLVREREAAGEIFVIRPSSVLGVGRVERDPQRLMLLYDQGYHETLERERELRDFLSGT